MATAHKKTGRGKDGKSGLKKDPLLPSFPRPKS
jgi:hypothetical protein